MGAIERLSSLFGRKKEPPMTYQQMSDEVERYFAQDNQLREIARGRGIPVRSYSIKADPRLMNQFGQSPEAQDRYAVKHWQKGKSQRDEELARWIELLGATTVRSVVGEPKQVIEERTARKRLLKGL